jgi:hypothetical protein
VGPLLGDRTDHLDTVEFVAVDRRRERRSSPARRR